MIDLQFSQSNCVETGQEPEAIQQYVHALLSRQHSLDLLETIHQQINQVWVNIRRLLEGTSALHQAERRANAALQLLLASRPKRPSRKSPKLRRVSRTLRRKSRNTCSECC